MTTAHTLPLTNGSARLLNQMLTIPACFPTPADIYRAGALQDALPEIPDLPKEATPAEAKAWMIAAAGEIPLTEKQRETLKTAIKTAVEKLMLPPGPATNHLLRQLGVVEE